MGIQKNVALKSGKGLNFVSGLRSKYEEGATWGIKGGDKTTVWNKGMQVHQAGNPKCAAVIAVACLQSNDCWTFTPMNFGSISASGTNVKAQLELNGLADESIRQKMNL